LCLLFLFGLPAYGQDRDRDGDQAKEHPNGIVQDWSRRHLAYPRIGPMKSMIALQDDPRALLSWQEQTREDWHRDRDRHHHRDHDDDQDDTPTTATGLHRDWSISLGTGSTAPAMYPAKFGFSPIAAPSCASDFVVFPVNIAGSATQPNIVAFNNLYSGGTAIAPTGLCGSRTVVAGDNRSSATTLWSYDINAAGGLVATSPALSIDGTKVAFVETVAGSSTHFHVLAWSSGDGVDAANLQNVLLPVAITSFTGLVAPVAGSGTASDLSLGATGDTLSSPFVDYTKDVAYVGNDAGVLFRIKNVFCPPLSACATGGSPAPSLDTTWNSTGSVTIGGTCVGMLTGAVVDFGTGNVFVGCADGNLYGFTSTGTALSPTASISVGDGNLTTGGIVDPPLIDVVNKFVYAASGSSGGSSVLVQASTTDLSGRVVAPLGTGAAFNLHAPSFNNAYFNGTLANSLLYDWAVSGGLITLYGVPFSAGQVMNPLATTSISVSGSTAVELSPTTEFLNGATDQLFVSGLLLTATVNVIKSNITNFPTAGTLTAGTANEGTGTSGIIVDNNSGSAQASSIYFGVLGAAAPNGNNAVKLTQSGLI
jgi:hypothetical protein